MLQLIHDKMRAAEKVHGGDSITWQVLSEVEKSGRTLRGGR